MITSLHRREKDGEMEKLEQRETKAEYKDIHKRCVCTPLGRMTSHQQFTQTMFLYTVWMLETMPRGTQQGKKREREIRAQEDVVCQRFAWQATIVSRDNGSVASNAELCTWWPSLCGKYKQQTRYSLLDLTKTARVACAFTNAKALAAIRMESQHSSETVRREIIAGRACSYPEELANLQNNGFRHSDGPQFPEGRSTVLEVRGRFLEDRQHCRQGQLSFLAGCAKSPVARPTSPGRPDFQEGHRVVQEGQPI